MRLSANLSLMFTEAPLLARFALARAAGFDCVEIQFPYDHTPMALKAAADGLPIDLINVPAGAPERGYLGLATDALQAGAFAAAVDSALLYADALGVQKLNILFGAPPAGQGAEETAAHVTHNLRLAAGRLAAAGVQGLVEMINPFDSPGFWLSSLAKTLTRCARRTIPICGCNSISTTWPAPSRTLWPRWRRPPRTSAMCSSPTRRAATSQAPAKLILPQPAPR